MLAPGAYRIGTRDYHVNASYVDTESPSEMGVSDHLCILVFSYGVGGGRPPISAGNDRCRRPTSYYDLLQWHHELE